MPAHRFVQIGRCIVDEQALGGRQSQATARTQIDAWLRFGEILPGGDHDEVDEPFRSESVHQLLAASLSAVGQLGGTQVGCTDTR